MPDPLDYTIGWVCAIATEYAAAQAFLDEKHPIPQFISENDPNTYTLGKMGNHNVVIVVLPRGQYGLSSATTVATDMCHSFPNVRMGLMVGIGGGIPSRKQDVRLGDIVVGIPGYGHGGVLQYILKTALEDEDLKTVGHLNGPPNVLLGAISGLSAEHDIHGHTIDDSINAILDISPKLREDYQRPQSSLDRLYLSDYTHVGDKTSACAESCGDSPSNLIARPSRDAEDGPSIHYGLIASDTTLCKDAIIRDKLAANGVLCLEMEAAGLVNEFPCLVVRGISDYADSHKNDQWQGYAAMAAAAYSKDLLRHVPSPKKVERKDSHDVSLSTRPVRAIDPASKGTLVMGENRCLLAVILVVCFLLSSFFFQYLVNRLKTFTF
jgi:nucleoside phosphorylase